MKPHKISTHLAYSDNCYFHVFLSVVWLSWNFARFHEIQFQTEPESFSLLSWKTKKFYSKKNFFGPLSISKQKSFVYWLNFPKGFVKTYTKLRDQTSTLLQSDFAKKVCLLYLGCITLARPLKRTLSALSSQSTYLRTKVLTLFSTEGDTLFPGLVIFRLDFF